jgi:uncharacterized membrane protein
VAVGNGIVNLSAMNPTRFISELDEGRIIAAIQAAESRTSGEIRVFVSKVATDDPRAAAEKHFVKLGMTKTAERNGVLLFIAPKSQNFAIIGDEGVHARCGQTFWEEVSAAMQENLRAADYTAALVLGIERAGEVLGHHFPSVTTDKNELPDELAGD